MDTRSFPYADEVDLDRAVLFAVGAHAPHARWDEIGILADINKEQVKASLDRLEDAGLIHPDHYHDGRSCASVTARGHDMLLCI